MERTIRMDAEDFVALTAPEAIFSDEELLREAARAVQNGHADSVDCNAGKEFAVVTYVYTLASNTWTFEVEYPVHHERDPGDACRPTHSTLRNMFVDTALSLMFLADKLTFINCVFGTDVKFDDFREFRAFNCTFLKPIEIVGDKILNSMEFDHCIINKFSMRTCVVSSNLDFKGNTFLAEFSMHITHIGGDVSFTQNDFCRILSVTQSTLNGLFLFYSNSCNLCLIDRCTMNNGTNFDECTFSEQFMLVNCRLNADATFNKVKLPYADLSSNYFSTLSIWDCECKDTISFIDSKFENDVVFNRVRSGKIDFIRTKMTAMVKIDSIPVECGRYCDAGSQPKEKCIDTLDFRDATIMGYLVVKNCFNTIDLKDCRISGGIDLDWDYLNVYRDGLIKKFRGDCRIRNANSDTMMTLYESMVNNKKYQDAEKYFQAHMLLRRFEPKNGKVRKVPVMSYLHELISGFGRSPKRLFAFVVWLILVYGLAYFLLGIGSPQDAVYFSGITFFTIGFTEVGVLNFAIKVLAIAEGFSGVFTMSYLVASLTRRNI